MPKRLIGTADLRRRSIRFCCFSCRSKVFPGKFGFGDHALKFEVVIPSSNGSEGNWAMRPRERRKTGNEHLSLLRLDQIIDFDHALVKLVLKEMFAAADDTISVCRGPL
jgi:hypothetical protein